MRPAPAPTHHDSRGPWMVAWLGGVGIGVANGAVREATYGRRVSEFTAHQVSTGVALGAFAAYFAALERRWPIAGRREAVQVGAMWAALTVAFEAALGRLVTHRSWHELLADYDIRRGRLWALVPAWLAIGPIVVRGAISRSPQQP